MGITIINTTPTVASPISDQIASLENPFTFTIPANTFNDANADDLTISASFSTLLNGLIFDSANTSITGTPTQIEDSDIIITADDGNRATVSTSFSLTVSDDFIIVDNNPRNIVYGAIVQNIIAQGGASPTGTITFASSPLNVANFDDINIGVLTISGAGTTIVTATRDSTSESDDVLLEVVVRFGLDIDGDGSRLTTTDGILIILFLIVYTNTIDTTGATTIDTQRDNQQILEFLQRGYTRLNIDGDD